MKIVLSYNGVVNRGGVISGWREKHNKFFATLCEGDRTVSWSTGPTRADAVANLILKLPQRVPIDSIGDNSVVEDRTGVPQDEL